MPKRIPQDLKSLTTIKMQPRKESSKMEVILCMDIAGRTGNDMARELGLTPARISVIRNSPLYVKRLGELRLQMEEKFVDKRTDRLSSGDPVEELFRENALHLAKELIVTAKEEKNPMVKLSAIKDGLDRAGYKSFTEKTKVTVEVTEKMADRWTRALEYEPRNDDRKTKVRFTQEVSS